MRAGDGPCDLPVLSKDLLRAHFDDLKSRDVASRRYYENSSGGSTGKPVTILQDDTYRDWCGAAEDLFFTTLMGVTEYQTVPKMYIWGSERDLFSQTTMVNRVMNWLADRVFINAFCMSKDELHRTVAIINRRRPVIIKGYAGSLYELALFIQGRGLKIHSPAVIYSAAEAVRPFMREVIERTFGSKVFDFYGSREVGAMAGECRLGKMHVFAFNNLVEVVDERNQPVAPGREGRILVTTLHNFAMPLIRYEVGDTAVLGKGCRCGLKLPTLERISGRVTDHFISRQGALVNGEYFTHLFYYKNWLSQFQVVQEEVDRIAIYYVPIGTVPQNDIDDIEHKIRLVMGSDCAIRWRQVGEVPKTPQGKHLFTRSLVASRRGLAR